MPASLLAFFITRNVLSAYVLCFRSRENVEVGARYSVAPTDALRHSKLFRRNIYTTISQ